MPESSHPVLPVELLRPITQDLAENLADLCSLSLASKTLQIEAERLLYKNMTLTDELKHTRFLTSIIGSPRRAMLVQFYSQIGIPHSGKRRLWILLCLAMKDMKNLKYIAFQTTQVASSTDFLSEYPFQLDALECRGAYHSSQTLSKFLRHQPKLKRLHVEWSEVEAAQILPSTCPQLNLLRGNRGAIEAFLPGRAITSLAWVPHPSDSFDRIDHLSQSFRNLKALSYGGLFVGPDLRLVIDHLQSIEVLKLFDPSLEELLLLSRISNLRILLMLCQFTRRQYPSPPFENLPDVIRGLFSACQSLDYIEISCDRSDYVQWFPDLHSPQVTFRSYKDVHPWWDTIKRQY